jgi:hypothetical protein
VPSPAAFEVEVEARNYRYVTENARSPNTKSTSKAADWGARPTRLNSQQAGSLGTFAAARIA